VLWEIIRLRAAILPSPALRAEHLLFKAGSSHPARYDIPSCFKDMPGEEEEVIASVPVPAAQAPCTWQPARMQPVKTPTQALVILFDI